MSDDTQQSCSIPPSESPSQVLPEICHLWPSPAFAPQLMPDSDATGTQEVSPESNLVSCLGHLAYRQVRRASKTASISSRAERHRLPSTSQLHHGKVQRISQESLPDFNITKLEVGPLLQCVSCDSRWTVQKGAAHKLSHITTCARKNSINPSTLRRLVERELLKIRHTKENDKKAMPCSDSADAVPQTYMESVVAEAQPRRKQRRTDTTGTLQPVSQTRAAILDRAKALLGPWETVPCDAPEPETTQTFGRSKLQGENFDPIAVHLSEDCATSRLALLRSMAGSPTTHAVRVE